MTSYYGMARTVAPSAAAQNTDICDTQQLTPVRLLCKAEHASTLCDKRNGQCQQANCRAHYTTSRYTLRAGKGGTARDPMHFCSASRNDTQSILSDTTLYIRTFLM